jgi:hypothetical protein
VVQRAVSAMHLGRLKWRNAFEWSIHFTSNFYSKNRENEGEGWFGESADFNGDNGLDRRERKY